MVAPSGRFSGAKMLTCFGPRCSRIKPDLGWPSGVRGAPLKLISIAVVLPLNFTTMALPFQTFVEKVPGAMPESKRMGIFDFDFKVRPLM